MRIVSKPSCCNYDSAGSFVATSHTVWTDMRFVYVLQSETEPARHYIGLTSDVPGRIAAHNGGHSVHTREHRPWKLLVALEFAYASSAGAFERYLKTGSGRAFAKRHFV